MRSVQEIIELTGHDWTLTGKRTFHVKIPNRPYMDLVIEGIGAAPDGRQLVSVAHYGELNGDLMRDPEMVFAVSREHTTNGRYKSWRWLPTYFRNDYAGVENISVEIVSPIKVIKWVDIVRDQRAFARTWDVNIREQGFIEAAREQLAKEREEAS